MRRGSASSPSINTSICSRTRRSRSRHGNTSGEGINSTVERCARKALGDDRSGDGSGDHWAYLRRMAAKSALESEMTEMRRAGEEDYWRFVEA